MNNLTKAYAQQECMTEEEAHKMLLQLGWDCYDPKEFLNDCGLPESLLSDAIQYAKGEFNTKSITRLQVGKQPFILFIN